MGGIITLLANIGEIATELSATTGVTLEAILTGEALAALEAEISSLMTIEGISGIVLGRGRRGLPGRAS